MKIKHFYEPPVSEAFTLRLEGVICASQDANWGATSATFGDVTESDVDFTFDFEF